MPSKPKVRRVLAKITLVLAAVLVAAAIGEVAVRLLKIGVYERPKVLDANGREVADLSDVVRVFGNQKAGESWTREMAAGTVLYGWYDRPKWKYFDSSGRVEYRINSLGLRDRELPQRRPDELRILAIGDSFTFGLGVVFDDCWAQVLERDLAQARSAPVEVINGGFCSGYRPSMYAPWLPAKGLTLDPDVVVVGLCLNDVSLDVPMVLPEPEPEPLFGGRVRLFVLAQRALSRLRTEPEKPVDFDIRNAWGHSTDGELCAQGLSSMRDTLAPRGIRMIVAIFPMLTRLKTHYPFTDVHAVVRDFCKTEHIEVVDLLDRFLGRDERELWVHPTDQHPNDVGHRLIADGIREYLARHPDGPRAEDGRPPLVPASVLDEAPVQKADVAFANGWRLVGIEQSLRSPTETLVTTFWDLTRPGAQGFEAFVQVDAEGGVATASRILAAPHGAKTEGRLLACPIPLVVEKPAHGLKTRLGLRIIGGGRVAADHSPHTRSSLPSYGDFMVVLPTPWSGLASRPVR